MRWRKFRSDPAAPGAGTAHVGACSDIGQVRTENQDSYGLFPPDAPSLFIVADGMGGHEDGGAASRIAVQVLTDHFGSSRGPIPQRLREAVAAANAAVWAEANSNGQSRRMGTTCTVLSLEHGHVHLAHVGDSRAYRVTASGVDQISEDHTVAAEMSAGGLLTPEEVARHPRRHALTRALGVGPEVQVFLRDVGMARGDERFVLCSDGLAEVPVAEVQRAALSYPPQEAAEWLVSQANSLGGTDNITVVIVHPTAPSDNTATLYSIGR